MAILINAQKLTHSYSHRPLFHEISFSIEESERIGLIGPNGAGKSTLLKILANKVEPDEGVVNYKRGIIVGYLEQVPSFQPKSSVWSTIIEKANDQNDHYIIAKAEQLLSLLSLNDENNIKPDTLISNLSGGWRKRVALGRELLLDPDILLLDEPTNHLDVESIIWLEEFLKKSSFATLTITHDRVFLDKVSTRIMELDRRNPNGLLSIQGTYGDYLEAKQSLMSDQEATEAKLKNTLRRETEWLRQGAKARTTKQQARINRAGELAEKVSELTDRNKKSVVELDFKSLEKNPKKLIEAIGVSKSYNKNLVVPKIDLLITPKSRIGLLGPNGAGKSTLLKILVGKEQPDTGTVMLADRLSVSYFEQNRELLNLNLSPIETLHPDNDHVTFGGKQLHVRSYLGKFLFKPEQMDLPVSKLSGGEQSRLLLSKLMLTPANLLILDEPTNDLDMETLNILQEVLSDFDGAVILVTHDRYFLDQVANQILAFDFNSNAQKKNIITFSDVPQWEAWVEQKVLSNQNTTTESKKQTQIPAPEQSKKKKLTYKDQFELDNMEQTILEAEQKLAKLIEESTLEENLSNPKVLSELSTKIAMAETEVERLYARWSELEELQS